MQNHNQFHFFRKAASLMQSRHASQLTFLPSKKSFCSISIRFTSKKKKRKVDYLVYQVTKNKYNAIIIYLIFQLLPSNIHLTKFVLKLLLLLENATNLRITFLHLQTDQIELILSLIMIVLY